MTLHQATHPGVLKHALQHSAAVGALGNCRDPEGVTAIPVMPSVASGQTEVVVVVVIVSVAVVRIVLVREMTAGVEVAVVVVVSVRVAVLVTVVLTTVVEMLVLGLCVPYV